MANVELKAWLERQGAEMDDLPGSNKGGTVEVDGVKVTLVNAFHSSGSDDGDYLGEAAGIVLELENGTKLYFAGDTCVFGDMQPIARIYSPDVAVLPIGGHFTMDPREAGVALELLGTKRCIPCHYGTFPLLHRTPDELREQAPSGSRSSSCSPGRPTRFERTLVRSDRAPGAGDRGRGRARARRRARAPRRLGRGRAQGGARAGPGGRRPGRLAGERQGGARATRSLIGDRPRVERELLDLDLTELTYG